jgi:hypothetical protein
VKPVAKAAVAGALMLGAVGAWQGVRAIQDQPDEKPVLPLGNGAASADDGNDGAPQRAKAPQPRPTPLSKVETPMAERVAVLGLLNKRNGQERDLTLKPGQGVRVGDVVVRLRACETTAPWEAEPLTGAFVQMDVQGRDQRWRRIFSGWLYKESPSLNVVEHPIYDVWPKSCAMTHPDMGPDTVAAGSVGGGASASSAKKSPAAPPAAAPDAAASEGASAPSASSNSTR